MDNRVKSAVSEADEAFWQVIVKHFPEVATGDLAPCEVFFWGNAIKRVVNAWLDENLVEAEQDVEP